MPVALQVFLRYPESVPQICGLLSCSVLLCCLLCLALSAFSSNSSVDHHLLFLFLYEQESGLCCAIGAESLPV